MAQNLRKPETFATSLPESAFNLYAWADALKACPDGLIWAMNKDLYEAWRSNDRPDFLLWIAARGGLLDLQQKQQVAMAVERLTRPWLGEQLWAEVVEDAAGRPLRLAYSVAMGTVKLPHCTADQRQALCTLIRQLIPEPQELPNRPLLNLESI